MNKKNRTIVPKMNKQKESKNKNKNDKIYQKKGRRMPMYELISKYEPSGDQPKAIKKLVDGIKKGTKHQVLLGATGTGKTFTIANVIKEINKPTLVLAHNKTLAGQLY